MGTAHSLRLRTAMKGGEGYEEDVESENGNGAGTETLGQKPSSVGNLKHVIVVHSC